jgi:methylated-DNA-[protein]-cysteine S-methyltransferase
MAHPFSTPKIKATFHIEKGQIEKITLSPSRQPTWEITEKTPLKSQIDEWMSAYLTKQKLPKIPLTLSQLSPFQQKVLNTLQSLKAPLSYGELATLIGNPKAARAVGGALNKNPYPLLIPCHWILSANQGIGGFAYTQEIKRELLNFEFPELARHLLSK